MFVKTTTYTYFLCWSWNIFMIKCIDLLLILVVAKTRGTAVFLPFYFLLYVTFGYEYNMKTISLPSTQMIYPPSQHSSINIAPQCLLSLMLSFWVFILCTAGIETYFTCMDSIVAVNLKWNGIMRLQDISLSHLQG